MNGDPHPAGFPVGRSLQPKGVLQGPAVACDARRGELDDGELPRLLSEATALDLAVLVEVHSRPELARAVDAGATIIGVNNRKLRTLTVDLSASRTLITEMPESVVSVAESGLRISADLVELGQAGYGAFLIGETFMSAPDPGERLGWLIDETRASQSGHKPDRMTGEVT